MKTLNDEHKCSRSFDLRIVGPKYLSKRYIREFKSVKGIIRCEFMKKSAHGCCFKYYHQYGL